LNSSPAKLLPSMNALQFRIVRGKCKDRASERAATRSSQPAPVRDAVKVSRSCGAGGSMSKSSKSWPACSVPAVLFSGSIQTCPPISAETRRRAPLGRATALRIASARTTIRAAGPRPRRGREASQPQAGRIPPRAAARSRGDAAPSAAGVSSVSIADPTAHGLPAAAARSRPSPSDG